MQQPKLPKLPKIETPLTPLQQAVTDIGEALENPIDNRGRHYDLRFLIPILAYHLARAGIGRIEGQAVIKKRRLPGGYIDWVPVDEPDTLEDELDGATLEDLPNLSPAAQAEFRRRAGMATPGPDPDDDLDAKVPWTVETRIRFDSEDN